MVDSGNPGDQITGVPAWRGRGLESSATSPSKESPADWAPRSSGVDPVLTGPEEAPDQAIYHPSQARLPCCILPAQRTRSGAKARSAGAGWRSGQGFGP